MMRQSDAKSHGGSSFVLSFVSLSNRKRMANEASLGWQQVIERMAMMMVGVILCQVELTSYYATYP